VALSALRGATGGVINQSRIQSQMPEAIPMPLEIRGRYQFSLQVQA